MKILLLVVFEYYYRNLTKLKSNHHMKSIGFSCQNLFASRCKQSRKWLFGDV